MGGERRRKAKPTDDWQELLPLFEWPEQEAYEELRPMVLFGSSVAERAAETGTPERTMYRRIERFEQNGMFSFFATDSATARARRRVLDPLGYVRFLDWRLYGEEALASREAAVWLQPESLTLEYGGQTLSAYDVELATDTGKPRTVGRPRLFETSYVLPQLRLFALDEGGWLKALKLEGYAPRRSASPMALQEVLFHYLDVL